MEENLESKKFWTALYTKPRHELAAEKQLRELGIETYVPVVTRIKQWSDRKKKVSEPLIRGYVFILGTEKERLLALQQNSIVNCVIFQGRPARIPEWQINNLKKMLDQNSEYFVRDLIRAGNRVKVIEGPFSGVEGIVLEEANSKFLAVSIDLLRRSVVAYLPPESIIKKIED